MKFVLSVLAVLTLVGSLNARAVHVTVPGTGSGALAKELQDFMDLIPVDRVMAILRAYAAQDKEFRTVMELIDTQETLLYVEELEALPAAKDLMNYMQNAGLDIYLIVNKLNAALGIEPITPFAFHKITGGLRGLTVDLEVAVPLKQMVDLMESKMEQSPVFAAFVDEVTSRKYNNLYNAFYSNQYVVNIAQQAKEAGLNSGTVRMNYVYFIIIRQVLKLHS